VSDGVRLRFSVLPLTVTANAGFIMLGYLCSFAKAAESLGHSRTAKLAVLAGGGGLTLAGMLANACRARHGVGPGQGRGRLQVHLHLAPDTQSQLVAHRQVVLATSLALPARKLTPAVN
jgi:hypothetical protein